MPRDEMLRPLKRMSLAQRLWRRRPGALPAAALTLVLAFAAGTAWLMRQPAPLAGQPVVVAAIPEQAEIITSSTTPAEDGASPEDEARGEGHEILLQVPMEPVGYPATNPGPRTLLSDATPAQNLAALKWLMSRFSGYSGITNYMGARLLVSAEALRPVMAEVNARGLAYLEDASVSMTQTSRLARDLRLPVQRATLMIDADPSAAAISAALAKLEKEAAKNGSAIATGSGLDVTIETVAEWAKTLQEKGILLVPVSAAYKGRAT